MTFKQSGKSTQVTKGDAVIRLLMNMGSKGDRRAVDAVINLIGKIERLVDQPEAERKDVGVMVVPGVLSPEEFRVELAKHRERKELEDQQWRKDAPNWDAKVRLNRNVMMLHKGTALGDNAAARFTELTQSFEYVRNPYITRQLHPSEQEGEEYRRKHKALMAAEKGGA